MPNYSKATVTGQGILRDVRNGKERPWRKKKKQNTEFADLLEILGYLKARRVSECADVLQFVITETGHYKLKKTWFCKSRLCPMCSWRRSIKYAVDVSKIVEESLKRHPNGRWIFLTFTTKNTTNAEDLSLEIKQYSSAIRNMLRTKLLKGLVYGFSRGIEITVNKENGSYNQHVHVLLFVSSTYFKSGKYISQEKWVQIWRKAMKLDYDPSVDVRAIKGGDVEERFKAVLEVAKYPVKSIDYLGGDQEDNLKVVEDLEKALYRKRLTAFGGLLKEIQKELNIADVESEQSDLVVTGEDVEQENETDEIVTATWNAKKQNYFLKKSSDR